MITTVIQICQGMRFVELLLLEASAFRYVVMPLTYPPETDCYTESNKREGALTFLSIHEAKTRGWWPQVQELQGKASSMELVVETSVSDSWPESSCCS